MKHLTLHRIASLLYRFIASVVQLWDLQILVASMPKRLTKATEGWVDYHLLVHTDLFVTK
jgi:hypothetical protein